MDWFFEQVYNVLEQIPYGRVVSYGQIARLLGHPRAARQVGRAMRCCPEHLPWQRVVMADGSVVGGGFADVRRMMLEAEGVAFLPDGRVDMEKHGWLGSAQGSDAAGAVSLLDVTEDNYRDVCGLSVAKGQEGFVAVPTAILARAYAKRSRNARALAIASSGVIVGVLMYMELPEEPACYTIEQFLIDKGHQRKGFGKRALRLAIDILEGEGKYGSIDVCVKSEASNAIRMYMDAGFVDTGYVDPDEPDSLVLRYSFA